MPVYTYQCNLCEEPEEERRPVDQRDRERPCYWCGLGTVRRVFAPTANIHIGDHFHYLQSEFQPPKGDPSWEYLGRDDQVHAPPKDDGHKQFLLERFRGRLG